eukprot:555272_1
MGCSLSNNCGCKYGQLTNFYDNMDEIESTEDMIDKLVIGYIRNSIQELLPHDVEILCIHYFGTDGVDGHLIVPKYGRITLDKQCMYQFSSILINENGTLKCSPRQTIHIMCFGDVIIERNGQINFDGMGYCGGSENCKGESYENECTRCCCLNYDGGGGGGSWCGSGGGGSYGSCGQCGGCDSCFCCCWHCCFCCNYGWNGCKYGNKKLSVLHLGSGGGGGDRGAGIDCAAPQGGNGGGAIRLQCFGTIILKQEARMSCNGISGIGDSGGGSGGSIHIIINDKNNIEMDMTAKISAKGGASNQDGGDGRIRIECLMRHKNKILRDNYNIRPQPYIG